MMVIIVAIHIANFDDDIDGCSYHCYYDADVDLDNDVVVYIIMFFIYIF